MDFPAYRHIHRDVDTFFSHVSSAESIRYKCEICEVQLASLVVRARHERDETHRKRVQHINSLKQNHVIHQCAKLQYRLDGLSDQTMVAEAERELYRILLLRGSAEYSTEANELLRVVDGHIKRSEDVERMLLLQLAAWKVICLVDSPSTSEPEMSTYHEWRFWSQEGWKERKQDMKDANEIDIIVRAVRPFIG